ncbi:hypothetical protein Tco_0950056 [Tanacetum coccineum]
MADAKLARRVSMSSPTDSICSGGDGTSGGGGSGDGVTNGGGDGEGDLDLLRDKDGKSDGDGEDNNGKSDSGSKDDDGISDGTNKASMRSDDGGAGLTGKVVISSDMMTNGANTLACGVVAGKGVRQGLVLGLKAFLKLLLLSSCCWCISYYCLLRVNVAGTKLQLLKVTTAKRLQLLKDKDCLKIKITYEIRIVIYRIDL